MAKFDIDDDLKVSMGVEVSIGEYAPRGTVEITENGTHNVGGFKYADVDIETPPPILQSKSATPTESSQTVVADSGYDGLSEVAIDAIPSQYIIPSGSTMITSNGIYDVTDYASVNIDVAGGTPLVERLSSFSYANDEATVVGDYAFYSYRSIQNVSFANASQVSVGAFWGATALKTVNMPSLEKIHTSAFMNAISLNTIIAPNVTYISNSAFYSCSSLQSINFPNLTVLGLNAFYGCRSLQSIEFPLLSMVSSSAFQFCSTLSYVSLNSVTHINSNAFYYCHNLSEIHIPNVLQINTSAFNFCSKLSSISISNCRELGQGAFLSCINLTDIYAPKVCTIGNGTFSNCYNLNEIYMPMISRTSTYAFYKCSSLNDVHFPLATYVDNWAFASCIGLNSITLQGTNSIGTAAFSYCSSITSVVCQNLHTLGNGAFFSCSALSFVLFGGSNMTTPQYTYSFIIYQSAFQYCSNLMSLYLLASQIYALSTSSAFNNTPLLNSSYTGEFGSIYVPESLYSEYISASNWNVFSSRFVSMSNTEIDALLAEHNIEGNSFVFSKYDSDTSGVQTFTVDFSNLNNGDVFVVYYRCGSERSGVINYYDNIAYEEIVYDETKSSYTINANIQTNVTGTIVLDFDNGAVRTNISNVQVYLLLMCKKEYFPSRS